MFGEEPKRKRKYCLDDNPFIMLHHLLLVSLSSAPKEPQKMSEHKNFLCFDDQEAAHFIALTPFSYFSTK